MLGVGRRHYPFVHALFIHRDRRGRERGIRECTNRDRKELFHAQQFVEDRRATVRTEVEPGSRTLVTWTGVRGRLAGNGHVLARIPCLFRKGASGAALARQAMADGDANRLTGDNSRELATAARGKSSSQSVLLKLEQVVPDNAYEQAYRLSMQSADAAFNFQFPRYRVPR